MSRPLPIAAVQAEPVPVEGAVDVFAASAAGVAADFPQAELLVYPELYLCGLNGRAEERVPGSQAGGPHRSEQLRRARVARRSPWREDVQSPTVQVGPAPRVWALNHREIEAVDSAVFQGRLGLGPAVQTTSSLGSPIVGQRSRGVSRPERGNFNDKEVKGCLVSTGSGDEERAWAAEKRDFVADRRDEVADERDRVAEIRDRTVDAREAELDEWERHLDARAAELGVSDERTEVSASGADARAGRSQARQNREEARAERAIAAADRGEAVKRRQADAPPTRLAMVFAGIAEQLYDADSFDDVLLRIAEAAVSTVAGCRMASVTLVDRSGYRTAASTDSAALAVDQAQYQAQEGPCLDAVDAPMVYAQSFPDKRWPTLAARPIESGVQSALSYRLAAASSGAADSAGGSLNSYGVNPYAFSDTAQEIGLILAAHASVAARAVDERSTLRS